MSDMRLNRLNFDHGIDTITYGHKEAAATMPERGDAAPADIGVRAQLDLLLQKPSMDSRLDAALRLQLENRELLRPGRFNRALGHAKKRVRTAASSAAEGSEEARVLNRAMRLLGDESNLRDQVEEYRNALYQG